MTILVTGGAGYIGSILVEGLIKDGYKVIVIDDLREGHSEAVAPEATFIEGDIGDQRILKEALGGCSVDAVIHMAAETTIEYSMRDPGRYFQANVIKGITLLDAMREYGVDKMVFSSTAAVYGVPQAIVITEEHPRSPINAYGESKLMFERVLDWYHRAYHLRVISLRYFNAAGASGQRGEDHRHESHLIPNVLRVALSQGTAVEVFGTDYETKDGSCVRDYIHVVDLARAHILALEHLKERSGRVYNLGSGNGCSVLEVISTAEKVLGRKIPVAVHPRRPGDPPVLVASPARAGEELGWQPQQGGLESIIQTAWDWRRRHPHGYGETARSVSRAEAGS